MDVKAEAFYLAIGLVTTIMLIAAAWGIWQATPWGRLNRLRRQITDPLVGAFKEILYTLRWMKRPILRPSFEDLVAERKQIRKEQFRDWEQEFKALLPPPPLNPKRLREWHADQGRIIHVSINFRPHPRACKNRQFDVDVDRIYEGYGGEHVRAVYTAHCYTCGWSSEVPDAVVTYGSDGDLTIGSLEAAEEYLKEQRQQELTIRQMTNKYAMMKEQRNGR